MIPFTVTIGRIPHGIFHGQECLLICETREDAEEVRLKNPAFKQLRSAGIKLEIRPLPDSGSKIYQSSV